MVGVKMAAAAAASIRERQTVALKRMLNFNVPHVKNSTGEPVWKVLIYDRFGQDIISPLLSVKELRDMGITLHLLLHSDRDPIPDVPAVYFVMPTEENIDRMCQVFDQYLNFITLEDDMFVLCNQNKELVSYRAINRPDITDTEMETVMDTIVDSLFCFFVTLEVAESVQQELESYRAQEDEVKRLKSIMGLEGEDEGAISMLSDNTAKLTSAVRAFAKMASAPTSYGSTTTKPMGLLSRVMNTGSQFVMEGVKNLVLKQQGFDNQDSSNSCPNFTV
ncbi:hypothetical protein CB1_001484001 [Camelus ferus]|nr:hypothetical protein CB1_001484001 [Camelus ferus]